MDKSTDTPEYVALMEAINEAERAFQVARTIENEARSVATRRENELNKARKAFVDYLVSNQPQMVDEIARRKFHR